MSDFDFALGFVAGEGTFTLSMNTADGKHYPRMRFQVRVHDNDIDVLRACKETFEEHAQQELGSISNLSSRDTVEWVVRRKDELEVLHDTIRDDSPCIWWRSEKYRNFEVWSDILNIHTDGRTTPKQAIEMCKLARGGLNVNNGVSTKRWDEYIESLKNR